MEERNIALNPKREGYPHPLESDRGWGGGSDKWEIIDGRRTYPEWHHGLAFTGGRRNWAGEPCGERQATINFGEPKTFYKVIIWHHGLMHIPKECKLQYWDGSKWIDIDSNREVDLEGEYGTWSAPDTHIFTPVTGSKVRYVINNCKESMEGKKMEHGWIYEFEIYKAPLISERIENLPIEAIEGIGEKYGKRLRQRGKEKIKDLALEDIRNIPMLSQQAKLPLLQLYVAKKRAELALLVRIDPVFASIGNRTLEDIMKTSYEDLSTQTRYPMESICDLKRKISTLLCALDNSIIKPMPLENVLMWERRYRR